MATTPFSLRLDEETKSRLEAQARVMDRSASYVAQEAIKSYLAATEAKQQAIEAAVAQANEGAFVSSQTTRKWLESLGTENEQPRPTADVTTDR